MNGLMAELTELSGLAEVAIWHAALVFLRVGAMVSLLPVLGEQALPQRVRLAAAVAMTLVIAPAVPAGPSHSMTALGAEAVAGLMLGMGLRLLVLGLQTAGTLAAQAISLTQMFNGTGPEPQPIVSNLLTMAALVLFLGMGGLARAVELVVLSYDMIPPGTLPDAAQVAEWGLGRITQVFALSFALAAPFVLAALLYNLALGAINRAMPALMVTMIGAPALTLGGLVLLALVSPFVLQAWQGALSKALAAPFGAG